MKNKLLMKLDKDKENRAKVFKEIYKENKIVILEFKEKMKKLENQGREVTEYETES
jgi:hypothetical protein